ncbi:MAG TPA: hypothetical protein VFT69_19265 [Pseudolabrys sp.]|jgi:predicted transcriptional regulator|nr:hypothetical protein [Pseudolabrys sp.]
MKAKVLNDALKRVETWPEDAQAMLAELAFEIDGELQESKVHASAAELEGIDRGLEAARDGRLVSQQKIESLMAKHRPR